MPTPWEPMAYGRGRDMDGDKFFWITQIILLSLLALAILTPDE